ncbi:MAG TPA: phosphohistidine phosphatase SixA [Verrucomicrobiae bacterium]|jgi:phosphohistidine phosphatase|nr:phosphohistidine phosphatase SixA [Verrucomicrobiae bacterium]
MNLYFLRHAKAEPRSPKWRPDSKRPLTKDGEKRMFDVARGMKKLDVPFDLILTSPYARALRTAQIVVETYHARKLFQTTKLSSDADPRGIIDEINDNFSTLKDIILVGHEPFLSGLMSALLTGESGLKIDFKKAGLSKLTVSELRFGKCACLDWLLTARQLARIGKRS